MAPHRNLRLAAASLCLALCAAAPAAARHTRMGACPRTLANQLTTMGTATQLVTVVAARRTATRGALQLWRKRGDCWVANAGPWPAWLGERGTSLHKREGDETTPAGVFGFGPVMYGIAPNPGVHYPYRRIACGDWWVEDPRSPFYNQFHHVRCGATPPFRVTSGDMSRSPTAYRHLAVIAYNSAPIVPGRGSGIFLHVSTGRPTLGCVSLALPQLLALLRWLRPESEPLIGIGSRVDFRGF